MDWLVEQVFVGLPRMSCFEALGLRISTPTLARKRPQLWPTNVKVDASNACTGTTIRPHLMVLNTPHAVA